jgi:O-acetylhomoserine (thiol)-lyase
MKFNTMLLHGNFAPDKSSGATSSPIYQSTAFAHSTAEELENIFKGSEFGYIYSRINNPTIEAFERRIAFLENGIGAAACSSGMSAITLSMLNILRIGDEIISGSGIFGGTFSLFENFKNCGIITKYTEGSSAKHFEKLITDKTKVIFVETIGNPKLDVPDLKKIAALTHSKSILFIVDNTVTTPYLINPINYGADIVIHSTSKYINGSGNSIGGVIVDSGNFHWEVNKYPAMEDFIKYGGFAYLAKLRQGIFKDFGACMSPFNAFLTMIGLETLGIRMNFLCENAFKLALHLKNNSKIQEVNYPGLKESPFYEIANTQFRQKFGAVVTIRVGTKEKAFALINNLKLILNLSNIGDVRTLVIHPASTIYASNSISEKETVGVYEDLIRISLGLEEIDDIIEDFEQAIEKI